MTDWASLHDHTKASDDPISSISTIAYGFMGSQTLFAALELGLFTTLSDDPCGPCRRSAEIAAQQFLPDLAFLVSGVKR